MQEVEVLQLVNMDTEIKNKTWHWTCAAYTAIVSSLQLCVLYLKKKKKTKQKKKKVQKKSVQIE